MRTIRKIGPFALLICLASSTWGGTLHVDGANTLGPWDGTPEQPYQSIQDAIDATEGGDTVLVAAGTYPERIRVLLKDNVRIVGAGAESTVIDGGFEGHVVAFQNCSGGELRGFTITNSGATQLFHGGVFTSVANATISENVITGNNRGITVSSGSDVLILRNRVVDNEDYGIYFLTGSLGTVAGNLIAGNGDDPLRMFSSSADVLHNTIADNAGRGILCNPDEPMSIRHNIIAGADTGIFVLGDFQSALPLVDIAYNDIWNSSFADYWEEYGPLQNVTSQPFVPQPGTGEIQVDPLFIDNGGGDYSLHSDSPCVDAGQPPGEFGGFPCQDLEGRPRLLDADGNHLAQPDMGAYELSTPGLVPGEVQGLRWESSVDTLVWDPEPDSEGYNVYRGHGEQLGNANWGGCLDQVPATELLDEEVPSSGQLFFYLVCGVLDLQEGTMGFANCVERSNFAPCAGI